MIVKWIAGTEVKGLKVDTKKTKLMFSYPTTVIIEEKGKRPCVV